VRTRFDPDVADRHQCYVKLCPTTTMTTSTTASTTPMPECTSGALEMRFNVDGLCCEDQSIASNMQTSFTPRTPVSSTEEECVQQCNNDPDCVAADLSFGYTAGAQYLWVCTLLVGPLPKLRTSGCSSLGSDPNGRCHHKACSAPTVAPSTTVPPVVTRPRTPPTTSTVVTTSTTKTIPPAPTTTERPGCRKVMRPLFVGKGCCEMDGAYELGIGETFEARSEMECVNWCKTAPECVAMDVFRESSGEHVCTKIVGMGSGLSYCVSVPELSCWTKHCDGSPTLVPTQPLLEDNEAGQQCRSCLGLIIALLLISGLCVDT